MATAAVERDTALLTEHGFGALFEIGGEYVDIDALGQMTSAYSEGVRTSRRIKSGFWLSSVENSPALREESPSGVEQEKKEQRLIKRKRESVRKCIVNENKKWRIVDEKTGRPREIGAMMGRSAWTFGRKPAGRHQVWTQKRRA